MWETPIGQDLSLKFLMKIMESKVFLVKNYLMRITFLLYNKMFSTTYISLFFQHKKWTNKIHQLVKIFYWTFWWKSWNQKYIVWRNIQWKAPFYFTIIKMFHKLTPIFIFSTQENIARLLGVIVVNLCCFDLFEDFSL